MAPRWLADIPIAIGLGALVALGYAKAYRGFYYSKSFVHTCVVTVLLISILIGIISESARQSESLGTPLAFALVGLLGLIRFRTVVRDTREFSFVLLAIVTGVGVGSGHRILAATGCLGALAVLTVLERFDIGAPTALSMRLRIRGPQHQTDRYEDIIRARALRSDLVAARNTSDGMTVLDFDILAVPGQTLPGVAHELVILEGTMEVVARRWSRGRASEGADDT